MGRSATAIVVILVLGSIVGLPQGAAATAQPDLRVVFAGMNPTLPTAGQSIVITANVTNIGAASVPANTTWIVKFYIDGVEVGFNSTNATLGVGASMVFRNPGWTSTAGSHVINVTVDPDGNVTEASETNNSAGTGCFKVLTPAGLIDSRFETGSAWWAKRFWLPATASVTLSVITRFNSSFDAANFGTGLWVRDANDGLWVAFPAVGWSTRSFTHVQSRTVLGETSEHEDAASPPYTSAPFVHSRTITLPAGNYTFTGIGASDRIRNVTLSLSSSIATFSGNETGGVGVRLWREWQFTGDLVGSVERHEDHSFIHDASTARTILNASVPFNVTGRFFGAIIGVGQVIDVGYSGPGPFHTFASGFITAHCVSFDGAHAGAWTMNVRRYVGVGQEVFAPAVFDCALEDTAFSATSSNAVVAFAADVTLPPPDC
ncbi:MAG: hypothetical protein HY556_01900 [Euryarchaeota archaeon]|nr:hypothetical protein [Euryarchaeota archaeon]